MRTSRGEEKVLRERHLPRARDAAGRRGRVAHRAARRSCARRCSPRAIRSGARRWRRRRWPRSSLRPHRHRELDESTTTSCRPTRRSTPSTRRDHVRRSVPRLDPADATSPLERPSPRVDAEARVARSAGAAGAVAAATGRVAASGPRGTARRRQTHRKEISDRSTTSRPRSTTPTATRISGTRYEKIGADAIARYRRLRGDDVHFLIGMDEHGQKVAQTAEAQGIAPQALVDALAARFHAMWQRLGISYDQFIRTTDAAHTRRRARADRAHLRAQPDRLLREGVRGLVLRRLRVVQAGRRDRRRQVRAASHAHARVGRGAQLVLPAESRTRISCAQRSSSIRNSLQPESRRNEMLALLDQRLEDVSASRVAAGVGSSLPQAAQHRRDADDVRLVRRAAELPHRDGISRRRVERSLAGAAARRRQGHHALPLDHLARDAGGRRTSAAGARVGARLRAARRRAVQQVGRRAARSRRSDRPVRRRCVPLLPPARSSVRRRRKLLVGAVRGALQRRSGERVGQPREPRDLDGRAILRRRRSGWRSHRIGPARTQRTSPTITRRWTARAASCCTRRSRSSGRA